VNIDNAPMNRIARSFLGDRGWMDQARSLATALRTRHRPGGLLIVGTLAHEPWHLTAHLTEAAQRPGLTHLAPILIRHHVPDDAAPHLAIDLSRFERCGRGETIQWLLTWLPAAGNQRYGRP
jgi:hypothetical protein